MLTADWIVLVGYLGATVVFGLLSGKTVKNSSDMFVAGGRSPWWLSGLSAFMTMFSANTFVVWGGIAYEHGLVAVSINMCYGVAALLAGYTVAGKWKQLGIRTPAEYVEKRFGRSAVHFYTWFMMVFRLVGTGGALYAIARLTVTVIAGHDAVGDVSLSSWHLNAAIGVFAVIVIGYTMIGGLWAVLVTDMLQFIILNLAVIFVIPLTIAQLGGLGTLVDGAPEGFFSLAQGLGEPGARYTWMFLAGWVAIHYFMIGSEWAFVQRYLCVPSPKDARKSAYLFGFLYLFSPLLWLLPPLLWRIREPIPAGADSETVTRMAETAYILSCKAVLPNGMLGLMLAALFSATASMISTQLNVFSSVLTRNIFEPLVGELGERELVKMGRIFTCFLGLCIGGIAIGTPYLGGAASLIITVTELMVTPILAPTLFALTFKRICTRTIWVTVGICFPLGLAGRFLPAYRDTIFGNTLFTSVILPVVIVVLFAVLSREEATGWGRIEACRKVADEGPKAVPSTMPALFLSSSVGLCGLTLFALIPINEESRTLLAGFGVVMVSFSILTLWLALRRRVG